MKITVDQHRVVTEDAVREPQLFKLASGDLLLTYHVQPDRHFAERHGMRSRDGGASWQPEPRRAHREQSIGQSREGLVLAPDIHTFEREPGEYLGSFYQSEDGGATFSGPHELVVRINRVASRGYPEPAHYPPENHALRKFFQPVPDYYKACIGKSSQRWGPMFWRYLVEHEGRWLAPMQCRFHGDKFYRTVLVASEDGGTTWRFVVTIAEFLNEFRIPGDGFCEPALAVVADGSLLCVMRRGGGLPLAQCRSWDGGRTWSKPEMLAGHGVDPDLFLMSNGKLACTFGRPGLHLMFSPDGAGYAWGYRTVIGEWPSSTYMGIAEVSPGELLLVYDRGPEGETTYDPATRFIGSCRVKLE